jgi:hypothetical protein
MAIRHSQLWAAAPSRLDPLERRDQRLQQERQRPMQIDPTREEAEAEVVAVRIITVAEDADPRGVCLTKHGSMIGFAPRKCG